MTSPTYHSTVILLGNGKPLGTAFLVHETGLLATCFHILRDRFQSAANAVGQELQYVTLPESELPNPAVRQAEVMSQFDSANDVALLQIRGEVPTQLQPVKLICSEHPTLSGTAFSLQGYGDIPDPGVLYRHYLALGTIDGWVPRDQVKVLKISSKDLYRGMSGGAIYATQLGGVVGMQSRRLNIDPKQGLQGRDTGFACVSEAIAALAPDVLTIHEPTVQPPTLITPSLRNINAQAVQSPGGVPATAVMLADIRLAQDWSRPLEVGRPSQPEIPRPTALQTIREILAAGDRHAPSTSLALWGVGGSGKSTLAAQYAWRYSEAYPGGVIWAELGEQFDPAQGLQPILTRWAGWGYGGTQQLAELLGQQRVDITTQDIFRLFKDHGKMLAVIDNVHQGEHLNALLEALPPDTDLLITTPSQQSLEGATVAPQFLDVQRVAAADAIAFLRDRLPQLPEALLTQLAATFDYHAQALMLISAELQTSPDPQALAQQLLQRENHSALEPIHAAFDYSYQQLPSDRDRRCFQQLGLLQPIHAGFRVTLAAALWNVDGPTAQAILETLQQRSLITQVSSEYWSMNSLLYAYASDLLATQNPELQAQTLARYRQHVFELAFMEHAWAIAQPELPHLRYVGAELVREVTARYPIPATLDAAPDDTLDDEQRLFWKDAANYIISARQYLLQPQAKGLAELWLTALVTVGQVLNEPAGTALGFFLLGHWYQLYGDAQQSEALEQSCQMFDKAHQLWQLTGDIQSAGYALSGKGNILRLQGKTREALATFETALAEMDQAGYDDRELQTTLLISLSRQYLGINKHDQARQYLEQASELTADQPFNELAMEIAQQFSVLLLNRGQPEEAMQKLLQIREQAMHRGNEATVAQIDITIGFNHFQLGEGEAATEKFQAILEQANRLTCPQLKPPALTGLAAIHYANGEFQTAHDLLLQALELLERYQDKNLEAQILASLGEVAYAMNQLDDALDYLQRALPLLSTVQDTATGVKILNNIGLIYQQTNRINEGLDYLKKALPNIRELNNSGAEVTILNWLALLLSDIGDASQAMVYFDQAEPIIANIENDIERATILTLTANLYQIIGQMDKAAKRAQQVVEIWRKLNNRPKLCESLVLLAEIFYSQSKPDKVERLLEEVGQLTQDDDQTLARALYYNLRGLLDLQTANIKPERLDDAQEMFKRSAAINDHVKSPLVRIANFTNLAWIRFYKKDFEEAQKYFEGALEGARELNSSPHIAGALANLGVIKYFLQGTGPEAAQHLQEAITVMEKGGIINDSANRHIDTLRLLLRQVSQDTALPEESLKMLLSVENWEGLQFILQMRLDSLLSEEVDHLIVATMVAAKRKQQSPLEGILRYYRLLLDRCREAGIPSIQAMQHELEHLAVEYWWAYLQRVGRNYGVALAQINQVLEIEPRDIDALIERGWIHRGLGRMTAAIADFETVLEYSKRNHRAYQGKGVVYLELGRLDEAIALFTKAIDLDKKDAYNYHWRAMAYQFLADYSSAIEDLDEAVAIAPHISDHRYRRALLYLAKNEFDKARRELDIVIEQEEGPALAVDYFWRGVAYDLQDDSEGARFNWDEGLSYLKPADLMSLWTSPLYACLTDQEDVEEKYQILLKNPYPKHVLSVQDQNLKLLEKLYPKKRIYTRLRQMLEQELEKA